MVVCQTSITDTQEIALLGETIQLVLQFGFASIHISLLNKADCIVLGFKIENASLKMKLPPGISYHDSYFR